MIVFAQDEPQYADPFTLSAVSTAGCERLLSPGCGWLTATALCRSCDEHIVNLTLRNIHLKQGGPWLCDDVVSLPAVPCSALLFAFSARLQR